MFGTSPLSLKTTFDTAKKRAILTHRFLLVSLFDTNSFRCTKQNRDVWGHDEIGTIIKNNLTFVQIRNNSKEGDDFSKVYPRIDDWPHSAVIDPRTGENLAQWENDEAVEPTIFLQKLTSTIIKCTTSDFGIRLAKKRRYDEITDQTEDEQIAIAIAASMRSKIARNDPIVKNDSDDDAEPIENSDFESIGSGSDDGIEHSSSVDVPTFNLPETIPIILPQIKSATAIEEKIKFVLRTPKHEKLVLELRPDADCSVLRDKMNDAGYPLTSYELVRAYPKEKIDLSQGQTLRCVRIAHHDLFHIQLRM